MTVNEGQENVHDMMVIEEQCTHDVTAIWVAHPTANISKALSWLKQEKFFHSCLFSPVAFDVPCIPYLAHLPPGKVVLERTKC